MWLDGRVAVVTGGASGLGRAIVERFIAEGARVVAFDRNEERLRDLADAFGPAVATVAGDVRRHEDYRRAVAEAVGTFGRLDVMVANAGIWDWQTPLRELQAERIDAAFDEVFSVNVKACLHAAHAAYPALAQARGSLIMTLSNAAFTVQGGGPLYTASKHALDGLVRQLAYELAPYVRVNGVAPGGIATDLRGPEALDLGQRSIGSIPLASLVEQAMPLGRLPEASEYAGSYVLLASRQNGGAATGSIILADGGLGVRGFPNAAGGGDILDSIGKEGRAT